MLAQTFRKWDLERGREKEWLLARVQIVSLGTEFSELHRDSRMRYHQIKFEHL